LKYLFIRNNQHGFIKIVKFDHRFKNRWCIYKYICTHWTISKEIFIFAVRFFKKRSTRDRISEHTTNPWMPIARDSKRRRWPNFSTIGTSEWNGKFLKIATRRCQSWHFPVSKHRRNVTRISVTCLTHFRCQSRASSPLRELHRADRSIFVRAFVRDGNMTKWFHLGKFVSSCRKRHSWIFAVTCRGHSSHDIEVIRKCGGMHLEKERIRAFESWIFALNLYEYMYYVTALLCNDNVLLR